MDFAGVNYLAVVLAAAAAFVFGGVWYNVLGKQWMAAIGKSEDDIKKAGRPLPYLLAMTFVAQLVMAWVLAGLIGHLGRGQVNAWNGLLSGLFVWFGFVATTLIVNHGFQGSKPALTLIDGAHWLGVLAIQGLIIGLMGT